MAASHQQKHRDWNKTVNVGVQNQGNHGASGNTQAPAPKKKTRPRTIMCMDIAIQTGI